jgi:hypothetical protein
LLLGLIIYFAYSRKHSTLAIQAARGDGVRITAPATEVRRG